MNIVVLGAGAIGSLFGGLLSKEHNVVLIGNKKHVKIIKNKNLKIRGLTNKNFKIDSENDIRKISFSPDLLILSVKSFDTEKAIKQAKKIITKDTYVISLQNGLDNVDKIKKYVDCDKILVCLTTHGVVFSKPGLIIHKGIGKTFLTGLTDNAKDFSFSFSDVLNKAGIANSVCDDIFREIWVKAIINSSINPITAFFRCKNGYLLENPILKNIVEKICKESTNVAISQGFNICYNDMVEKTFEVISDTYDNHSSMLQSVLNDKKTEINSINGIIIKSAEKNSVNVSLNTILFYVLEGY